MAAASVASWTFFGEGWHAQCFEHQITISICYKFHLCKPRIVALRESIHK
ncbi:unnamed protein product [Ixodes pacificus]